MNKDQYSRYFLEDEKYIWQWILDGLFGLVCAVALFLMICAGLFFWHLFFGSGIDLSLFNPALLAKGKVCS